MKIPKKLKIGGYLYTVEMRERDKNDGSNNPGASFCRYQKIFIEKNAHKEQQESSLIHEILETIDYHYQLKMDHDKLSVLETALYQVLKDNKLLK